MRPERPSIALRKPLFGYRGKLLTLAALAAASPLAFMARGDLALSPAMAAAMAAAGLALIALAYLLRPIGAIAAALRACAGGAEPSQSLS